MSRDSLAQVDFIGVGINATDTLIRLPHFPAFDTKMQILSAETLPGGQVATAVVACQRWGLRTRYVGKIGDDAAGRLQRAEFAREGVEARLIEMPGCASQGSFILVDQSSGERTILWQRGDCLDLKPDELPRDWISRARLLHVDGHPTAPATTAAQWAHAGGGAVMADLDNLYPGVEALLEHVDYLFCSREFPQRLTGIANLFESLPEISRRFGCKISGATLGREGALAWDGAAFHYSRAFAVEATDTTGAGDLFHAGFAYSLLRDRPTPLAAAMEFSCAAAALNCTALGARGGIRTVKETERLVREGQRHEPTFNETELMRHSQRAAAAGYTSSKK